MIGLIFHLGSEVVEARVDGKSISFRTSSYGGQFVPIDSLYFSKEGVIKENPDLENDPLWKVKAIERFKESIKNKSENQIADYLIEDLQKYGYQPYLKHIKGFRPEKIK